MADISSLNLTPQEQRLWQHHLHNSQNIGTGGVQNSDGTVSTVLQATFEGPDGRTYSIPTVWDGKILPPQEALRKALGDGRSWKYWPSYGNDAEAQSRYQQLHQFMETPAQNDDGQGSMNQPNFFQMQMAKAANLLFGDPLPEQEGGSDFVGGGNLQSPSDRFSERAVAGGAPFTGKGVMAALGNAMGLMGGAAPVQMGAFSMAEKALGLTPGTLGGLSDIPGHFSIKHVPGERITLTQSLDRTDKAARDARAKQVSQNTRGASPPGRMGRGMGGGNSGGGFKAGGIGSGSRVGGPRFGRAGELMASPLGVSSAVGLGSSPLRMMGAQSSAPSGEFFNKSGFGANFADVAGGIRNITRNFAAGFGESPELRAQAQAGLDQEAAQQDASKRQIMEWTFKNLESLAEGVQGNPQALAAIQPYLEKSAANLQKLGLPQEQIDETMGYFQTLAQIPAAAKDVQLQQLYNPTTKENMAVNANDPQALADAQAKGFTALGGTQTSDVLSPEAQAQKIAIAQQSRPPAQPRSPSDMELAAIWLGSDNPELVAAGKHKLGLSGGENDPQDAATLRGQYLGQVKDFQTVRQNYQVVKAAEDTGAGDIARVFGYMKLLDPASTVREGEQATASNAAGVPEAIRGQWNKLIGGGQLSAEARSQIESQVDILYKTYEKQQKTTQKQFSEIAKGLKIDPALVVTEQTEGIEAGASQDNPVEVKTPEEAAKLPVGTFFRTPDGRVIQRQ